MKKLSTLVAAALTTFALYRVASAADLTNVTWISANLATLTSADKTDLLKFLNAQWPGSFSPTDIGQFKWADLQGSGQLYLVMTLAGPCAHSVGIDSRNSAGKLVLVQNIEGWADLNTAIRDLNGDGKDELIVQKPLVEYNCASIVTWPAVYRLENGKYVEASKEFPSYYDDEALPAINSEIERLEAKGETPNQVGVFSLIVVRDKILRVLGRDPHGWTQPGISVDEQRQPGSPAVRNRYFQGYRRTRTGGKCG
jgi:hypothetical protein